ncbi:substrate-binding periplasmic protein [Aestuariispira insulae]|uniref:Amino acid ABC transporter substrate-binding protein (PAAT family) n=1 Tax=Aestuariispira insulae TaxID=1461337 RepID=A0A3D9H5E0_9PROT|nr:ABC transporter substrate-binding protein [Aestuariispira insulae]RED44672.1 amino acid ABC transporter substrate-binding protein (PAAT family) [Aestuariispira insulae]
MKLSAFIAAFGFWMTLLTSALAQDARVVRFTTTHYPPYLDEQSSGGGFFTQIIREAYKTQGYQMEVKFFPWKRAVILAKDAQGFDGIFTFGTINEERERDYVISDPLPSLEWGFFRRVDRPIAYQKMDDLFPYRIGIVRGYAYGGGFDEQKEKFQSIVVANNDIALIRMLADDRADVILSDRYFAEYQLNRDLVDLRDQITFMEPALVTQGQWLAVSKKTDDPEAKVAAFNAGLKILRDSGRMQDILKGNYLY